MNSRRSQLGCMSIYSRIKELIIYLLLKRLQLSFLRMGYIMHWIIEMWYYEQEEDNLNGSARTVLHMLLSIMFCYFQRGRMDGIQEFQSIVLNLENERRIQGKEMGRNGLTHRWCLIHATISIIFMLETVLNHPSLSQKVTYLFVIGDLELEWFKNMKFRQWQRKLLSLRSNPQTGSPYIQNCDSLCTWTDLRKNH